MHSARTPIRNQQLGRNRSGGTECDEQDSNARDAYQSAGCGGESWIVDLDRNHDDRFGRVERCRLEHARKVVADVHGVEIVKNHLTWLIAAN